MEKFQVPNALIFGRRATMLQCGATERPCAEIGQCCLTVDRPEVGL
jgi:hypothetical protein